MPDDEKPDAGGEARAAKLRAKIDKLIDTAKGKQPDQPAGEKAPPESPRDFIHRRMAELDKKNDG